MMPRKQYAMFAFATVAATPFASVVAQQGLTAAEGKTSILTTDASVLAVEAKEAGVTLVLTRGLQGVPREWLNNLTFSVAAQKGKRSLFAKGEFTPGAKIENRLAIVRNADDENGGFFATYGTVGYEVVGREVAQANGDTPAVYSLETKTGQALSGGLGFNFAASETGVVIGVLATAARNWSLPFAKKPQQVCTQRAVGVDSKGAPVGVSDCGDRYVGNIRNANTGQLRLDVVSPRKWQRDPGLLTRLRTDSGAVRSAASAVIRLREGVDAAKQQLAVDSAQLDSALRRLSTPVTSGAGGLDSMAVRVPAVGAATLKYRASSVLVQQRAEVLANATKDLEANRATMKQGEHDFLNVPSFSLIGAASTNVERGIRPVHSVALGPAMYAALAPQRVVGAILFEINDLTDTIGKSSGTTNSLSDRFSVRVYVGVPF